MSVEDFGKEKTVYVTFLDTKPEEIVTVACAGL
jgi:hypothetical protein